MPQLKETLDILKRLSREFSIPLFSAVAWVLWVTYTDPSERNITKIIESFGKALFFVFFLTGNFNRVAKQRKTENSFSLLEGKMIALTMDVESATRRLMFVATGGNSFAYFELLTVGGSAAPSFPILVIHRGEFPLANLGARMIDMNTYHTNLEAGTPFASDTNIRIGDLSPEIALAIEPMASPAVPAQDWNVQFTARNGVWMQKIRARMVGDTWLIATVVYDKDGETIRLTNVAPGFPAIGEQAFDDAPREYVVYPNNSSDGH
ncbi:hypothetical protein HH800_01915 [Sphingobium yanoikuyae]|uniref:Uncharacterized protein n=1 Tax=Sphingobium yanoikuyae TaxID=13690 RepID=A0A6M4G1E0_SPHYA|nr:hypothetical protein [Sphingobium yanoikuyae]QJR01061.1 hypothetical protein HH800_01915 [Sphingobium yanoikuyae]